MERFNVGDRVRMIEKGQYSFDRVGMVGTVVGFVYEGLLEITVDGERHPIVGNGWTYFIENENWELIEEEREMPKYKFKVGDLVKGNDPRRYIITNDKMVKAKVLDVYGCDYIRIKILEHLDADYKNFATDEFDVDPQYFDFYEELKKESTFTPKFKVGDKVKILDEIYGHGFNIGQIVEVTQVCYDEELLNGKNYNYECRSEDGEIWYLDDLEIELVQKEKPKTTVLKLDNYKIIFNGDTTVVTDGVRKGVAKRHPDDEYDAVVGLQVALERFHGGRKPRIGDKVRVLKVDGNSRYGRHSYSFGEIVTVINFAESDTDVCCKDRSSFRQTLVAGEYEVLG